MTTVGSSELIEERALFQHHRRPYYPVKIGEVFRDRYRVLAKLGYGAYSTVWLARDQSSGQYACLKVCVRDDTDPSIENEVNMLRRLARKASESDHFGVRFTRLARDMFEIEGPTGRHSCIVMEPQGNNIRALQEWLPSSLMPKLMVRALVTGILLSLNWLHLECNVIHTDVSPTNVLLKPEPDFFEAIENSEIGDPSVPIIASDGAPVYMTRHKELTATPSPILSDFGKMRSFDLEADRTQTGWCMPDLYRAPEVLLKLPWHDTVDTWSVAIMALELLEGKNLFCPIDFEHRQYVLPLAIAQYIGYLGAPPLDLIERSPLFSTYFDDAGNWIGEVPIPQTSLEDFVTTIPPGKEKDMFLRFIRKLLTWDGDVRGTSSEMLTDEWLMSEIELSM